MCSRKSPQRASSHSGHIQCSTSAQPTAGAEVACRERQEMKQRAKRRPGVRLQDLHNVSLHMGTWATICEAQGLVLLTHYTKEQPHMKGTHSRG